jgi:hypothetical protein
VSLDDMHDSRQFLIVCRDICRDIADLSAIRVIDLTTRCRGRH